MTQSGTRFHPAFIAVELFSLLKGVGGFYVILFILKASSTATWVMIGRYLIVAITIIGIISTILKWFFHRYELRYNTIVIRNGIFVKNQHTVAIDKIHNHLSNSTFIHKWFGLTSLTLETAATGDLAPFQFPVITEREKARILAHIEPKHSEEIEETTVPLSLNKTVHFRSTKKDMLKASFTSLSFLAIFPLLSALYSNLANFFELEETAESALDYLLIHWWMLIVLFTIALGLSVVIGYIKTSIKYGNYMISDDNVRIYIEKGIGHYTSFSIQKHRVQAVIVEQSFLKRLLGLAAVKLVCVGDGSEPGQETSSLYPFMPKHEAYQLLQTILPGYHIEEYMKRFPVKVLWLKLLQPYYVTILAVIGLLLFKREWLWAAAVIFALSIANRILDYWFTSYIHHGRTVQIRKGGFTNETYVTHRERIQQITVSHSWLQRKFGVATISFANKANPLHISQLQGVSKEEAGTFFTWYHKKALN